MDNRTIGYLVSGFGAKVIVAGVAVWVAAYAGIAIVDLFQRVTDALGAL